MSCAVCGEDIGPSEAVTHTQFADGLLPTHSKCWDRQVMMSENHLSILLDFAYRGMAAVRCGCHIEREEGCAQCDALSEAERQIRPEWRGEIEWWKGKGFSLRGWWRDKMEKA